MAHPKVIHPDFNYEKEEAWGGERNSERRRERKTERQRHLFESAPSALPGLQGTLVDWLQRAETRCYRLWLPSLAGPSCTALAVPPRPGAVTPSQPSASWRRSSPWSRPAGLPAATPLGPPAQAPPGLWREPRAPGPHRSLDTASRNRPDTRSLCYPRGPTLLLSLSFSLSFFFLSQLP